MALKDFGKKDQIRPGAYSEAPKTLLFGPRGIPVEAHEEIDRIAALPRREPIDLDSLEAQIIVERETAKYARDRRGLEKCLCRELDPSSPCITTLLPVQAVTLREIAIAQGLWGSIAVGGGKSFLDLLSILALDDCPVGLLLVPAPLMKQICRQWEMLSQHFRVPTIIAHRTDGDWNRESPTKERQVLRVMSHNGISSPRQSGFIDKIRPDVIIVDESDAFADLTSARTIRLNRYMQENDETKVLCWTGSPSDSRIEEVAHLMAYALKDRSPMPIPTTVVKDVGRCVNAVDCPCPPGALEVFVEPEDDDDNGEIDTVRNAYRRRLIETAGVIMTSSADVEITGGEGLVAIEVTEINDLEIPARVNEALEMVRGGERPDTMFGNDHNEVFDDPMKQVRCAREIACGMFYRWIFPRREPREVIDRWFEVRKSYNSEVRAQIMQGQRHLDSPKLCEIAAMRFHGQLPLDPRYPVWPSRFWPEWKKVRDTVKPQTKACWIDDFMIEHAIEWARTHRAIIWYSNVEIASRMASLSGLPIYGGGPDAEDRIESLIRSPNPVGSVICSMNSHGRGRDGLQKRYEEQLVLNVPSSSKRNQQLYARLHRKGQRAEIVRSTIYTHTPELASAHRQALNRSDYVEALFGQRQKLKMGIGR